MEVLSLVRQNIWLLLFLVWGWPLLQYRSRFRKLVYQTDDWKINVQPKFLLELKGLLGNLYPENEDYQRLRNFYRFYLVVYVVLFLLWKWR